MASSHAVAQPRIRTWSGALALVGGAQTLPWLVHLFHLPGPVLLPMHFAGILAGLALGPTAGLLNGMAAPVISFLLTGLPPAVLVPALAVEVAAFGAVAGALARRTAWRGVWIVLTTLAVGRLVLLAVVAIGGPLLGLRPAGLPFLANDVMVGWPGIGLQLIVLSVLARKLAPVERR